MAYKSDQKAVKNMSKTQAIWSVNLYMHLKTRLGIIFSNKIRKRL